MVIAEILDVHILETRAMVVLRSRFKFVPFNHPTVRILVPVRCNVDVGMLRKGTALLDR